MLTRWIISGLLAILFVFGILTLTHILAFQGSLVALTAGFISLLLSRYVIINLRRQKAYEFPIKGQKIKKVLLLVGVVALILAVTWFCVMISVVPNTTAGVLLLFVPTFVLSAVAIFSLVFRIYFWVVQ